MTHDITFCTSTTCPLRDICKRADIPKVQHWISKAEFIHGVNGCIHFIQKP